MTSPMPIDDAAHLTPEQALDLAHGLLGADAALASQLQRHAGACAACAASLAAVEVEGRLLRERLPAAPAPPGLEGRVVETVQEAARSRTRIRRAVLVTAVVMLAAAGGAVFASRQRSGPDRHEVLVRAIESSEARALEALFGEVAK